MKPAALACLVLTGFAASCGGAHEGVATKPLHVIVVVLDAVRADHVGVLGYSRATTPQLDALATRGMLFERAWAGSSFGPQAHSSLWTGRLPSSGGSIGMEAAPSPELETLPRVFRRSGYRTALASNHAELRARTFTRGFDAFEIDSVPGRWSAEQVTEKALELADEAASGDPAAPLFLVVDYADAGPPHLPEPEERDRIDVQRPAQILDLHSLRSLAADPPARLRDTPEFQDLVARYDAEILAVDRQLGALVDGLEARGVMEDALLVVTASHGVEFLEHGYVGSGWTLHEEVLRVPLVVVAPGRLAPGRSSTPVSLVDLLPTLLVAAQGRVQDPEFATRAWLSKEDDHLVARVRSGVVMAELILPGLSVLHAAIDGDYKLVKVVEWTEPALRLERVAAIVERRARPERDEMEGVGTLKPTPRQHLYDLTQDPGESRDSAREHTARLSALLAELDHYLSQARAAGIRPIEPVETEAEAALQELRQVGYL